MPGSPKEACKASQSSLSTTQPQRLVSPRTGACCRPRPGNIMTGSTPAGLHSSIIWNEYDQHMLVGGVLGIAVAAS